MKSISCQAFFQKIMFDYDFCHCACKERPSGTLQSRQELEKPASATYRSQLQAAANAYEIYIYTEDRSISLYSSSRYFGSSLFFVI
jgi:hypothetical protein